LGDSLRGLNPLLATFMGVLLGLSLGLVPPASGAEVDVAAELGRGDCYRYKRSEKVLARLTNRARLTRGIVTMKLDPELSWVARYHTKKMVKRGELFHQTSQQLQDRITNWNALAENVGRGRTVRTVHRRFMRSESHRENILNPVYTHVGVGVVKKGDEKWVTVLFESILDPGTTLTMPRC
jgi:hypothetical protein